MSARKSYCCISFLIHFISLGLCGDINIGYAPSSIRFGTGPELRLSDLDKVFATSLGYSTGESLIWKGLTVISPFEYPSAIILFEIKNGGLDVQREGVPYSTKEDVSLKDIFKSLTTTMSNQAQRPLHYENTHISDLINEGIPPISLSFEHLKKDVEPDATFLREMALLPTITDKVSQVSSTSHKGQDVIFITIDSFSQVVEQYGVDSDKANEAASILRTALSQAYDRFRKIYDDTVIIGSIMSNNEENHVLKRRSLLSNDLHETRNLRKTKEEVNIAVEYSEDFPVMFNIVLFLSIILIITLIAISVEMSSMDPGRDSIIYRMTNPRMKKDQ